jgi:hypothetical protein
MIPWQHEIQRNLVELPGRTQQRWNLSPCSLTLSSPRIRWMFFGFGVFLFALKHHLYLSVCPFIVCIDSFGVRRFISRPSRMSCVNSRHLHENSSSPVIQNLCVMKISEGARRLSAVSSSACNQGSIYNMFVGSRGAVWSLGIPLPLIGPMSQGLGWRGCDLASFGWCGSLWFGYCLEGLEAVAKSSAYDIYIFLYLFVCLFIYLIVCLFIYLCVCYNHVGVNESGETFQFCVDCGTWHPMTAVAMASWALSSEQLEVLDLDKKCSEPEPKIGSDWPRLPQESKGAPTTPKGSPKATTRRPPGDSGRFTWLVSSKCQAMRTKRTKALVSSLHDHLVLPKDEPFGEGTSFASSTCSGSMSSTASQAPRETFPNIPNRSVC